MLTAYEARRLLRYEPRTGNLVWLHRAPSTFSTERAAKIWSAQYPGKVAGCAHKSSGYWHIKIKKTQYQAHRLVWLIVHGRWPVGEIDHINGNKTDNRIANLRDVSHAENGKNLMLSKRNNSGAVGVSFYSPRNKWVAKITVDSREIHLGYFEKKSDAIAARSSACRDYGFHENHGRPA